MFLVGQRLDIGGGLIFVKHTEEFGFTSVGKEGIANVFSFFAFLSRRMT